MGGIVGFLLTSLFSFKNNLNDKQKINLQSTDTTHWQWADSLDAVKAAPNNHQVIFENDKIRILDVILKPYEYENMHTHPLPSVMLGNNGDTSQFDIIYYRYSYDSVHHRYFANDSIHQHNGGAKASETNEADYLKPEGPHRIKNLSNVKIDVYRVEFKPERRQ